MLNLRDGRRAEHVRLVVADLRASLSVLNHVVGACNGHEVRIFNCEARASDLLRFVRAKVSVRTSCVQILTIIQLDRVCYRLKEFASPMLYVRPLINLDPRSAATFDRKRVKVLSLIRFDRHQVIARPMKFTILVGQLSIGVEQLCLTFGHIIFESCCSAWRVVNSLRLIVLKFNSARLVFETNRLATRA